ncbi:MAG: CBS domain-containing protein [Comamonadaceae bacterium]|nr:CBS domain-containing protein [Comamonadaceae bacterium]
MHEISGILDATELLERMLRGAQVDLAALLRPALYVPETVTIMDLLEHFKANKAELALVVDEFGEVEGVVTLADVLQALVGDLPALGEEGAEDVVRRDDGSWLIDGSVSTDRLHEVLATDEPFPGEADGGYHTIAGFVVTQTRTRTPKVSENFVWEDWRFEVVDMDRHRRGPGAGELERGQRRGRFPRAGRPVPIAPSPPVNPGHLIWVNRLSRLSAQIVRPKIPRRGSSRAQYKKWPECKLLTRSPPAPWRRAAPCKSRWPARLDVLQSGSGLLLGALHVGPHVLRLVDPARQGRDVDR